MAISDTITSMQNHLKNAYDKVSEKGGTLPSEKNMANLSEAIGSVKYTDMLLGLVNRNLTEFVDDNFTKIGGNLLEGISSLKKIDCPNALEIGSECCQYDHQLNNINLPKCQIIATSSLRYNNGMTHIDLPSALKIGSWAFYSNSNLKKVIIRTTSQVCSLDNTNAFTYTPIATSTTEGFIYVPDDLVDSYRDATNWTTYKTKIMPLSFVDGSYQEIDLGTLNWTYVGGNYTAYSSGLQSIIQTPANYSKMCNLMCSNYQTLPEGNLTSTDKSIALTSSGLILINDASLGTTASAVKTALSGIKLKYLLKGE